MAEINHLIDSPSAQHENELAAFSLIPKLTSGTSVAAKIFFNTVRVGSAAAVLSDRQD
jgi:hypothetical protein